MCALVSFDYAIIRVVPRVEREEFVNVGLVLFCPERRFLQARLHLQVSRLTALAPIWRRPRWLAASRSFPGCAGETRPWAILLACPRLGASTGW
jgi:hypothetical protein